MKVSRSVSVIFVAGLIVAGCSEKTNESAVADATPAAGTTASYTCQVETGRQQSLTLPSEGTIQFKYQVSGNTASITEVIGFVSTNYDFNVEANGTDKSIANYTGVFKGDYKNQENYNPSVYTNHFKFKDFDAVVSSRWDGGGMFGYLVVNKDNTAAKIDAHYIFQAGDHIGGSIDMSCKKI